MYLRLSAAFSLLGLCACANYDLSTNAAFKPTKEGFEYTNIADSVYPVNDNEAERQRLARLDQFILDTGICPNGYEMTSRNAVSKFAPNAVSAGIFDVHYIGVCI